MRGSHQCGSWQLKDEFLFCQRDPSLMPILPKVVNPDEIVARAKGDIYCQLNNGNETSSTETGYENRNAADVTTNRPPNRVCYRHRHF